MSPVRPADPVLAPVRIAIAMLAAFAALIVVVLLVRPDIMAAMMHAAMAAL